jgi:hypothetical protein
MLSLTAMGQNQTVRGNLNVNGNQTNTGSMTANSFSGNGGGLTGILTTDLAPIVATNLGTSTFFTVVNSGQAGGTTNLLNLVNMSGNNAIQVQGISDGASGQTNVVVILPNGITTTRSNLLAPTAISFPATTVNWTNPLPCTIELYIDNNGITGTTIKKNGTQIFGGLTTLVDVTIGLQVGEYFSETYTIGTPTARFSPL